MQIGRVELVDARTVEAFNAYKGTEYAVSPTLFMKFSGSEAAIERDVATAREISESEGCEAFEFEEDEEEREKLWEVRHEAAFAIEDLNPGKKMMSTDVCVPISCLPGALRESAQDHRGLWPRRGDPGARRGRQLPCRLPGGPHRRGRA
jgi:D-lactate dehydrogenase (cytochrome)